MVKYKLIYCAICAFTCVKYSRYAYAYIHCTRALIHLLTFYFIFYTIIFDGFIQQWFIRIRSFPYVPINIIIILQSSGDVVSLSRGSVGFWGDSRFVKCIASK